MVRQRFYEDRDYSRWRRKSWSRSATIVRFLILILSATATVLLGLATLDGFAALGFICSALVTTASAIEPYFNWRSRWVMAEEALAEWHKLEEDLAIYVASTPATNLDFNTILNYDKQRRAVWNTFSGQWIEQRQSGSMTSGTY
ncbi:SLATT domain-containing protein [Plantibacter sp. YIM 135249]|uniref:SLATT domain-containing protein n=1 Tax=Plantibacter sp. YIM 135249 TaxID=3423918 RepID=UPI003D355BB8